MALVSEAYLGNLDQLKKMIEQDKTDVNEPDPYGDTPLHAASYTGKYTLVQYLLEKGANINSKNGAGSTPLHKAVVGKQAGIVELLLKHKADTEIKNLAGLRPEYYTKNAGIIAALKAEHSVTKKISVPRERHGQLIGKKGKTLEGIRRKSGAQITVPKPTESTNEITIVGRADEVTRAEELIEEFLKREPAGGPKVPDVLPEGWASTELQVQRKNIRYIIGPKGSTIQRIIKDTGVNITVPGSRRRGQQQQVTPFEETNEDKIIVVGPINSVDEAIKRIYDVVTSKGTFYDD